MKPGSILLVRHEGFLPDQIRLHMALLGKQEGKKYFLPWNHAEFVLSYHGKLMSMGARAHGVEMSPLEDYIKEHPNYIVLEPKKLLTLEDVRKLEAYAEEVCFRNKRKYQNLNFLAWIGYIKSFGKIRLIKKGDKRLYCYELAARCASLIDRWTGDLEFVSIYDLWENKHYTH